MVSLDLLRKKLMIKFRGRIWCGPSCIDSTQITRLLTSCTPSLLGRKQVYIPSVEKPACVMLLVSLMLICEHEVLYTRITILNIHLSNSGVRNFIKIVLLDLKTQININPLIVGDFNTPLSTIDRLSGQNVNRETS